MEKIINFIRYGDYYLDVIDGFVNPIIKYLPKDKYMISQKYIDGMLNVSFFAETPPHSGIFISHGIADKSYRDGARVKDYDYICVSGDLWKTKMLNQGVPENKILVNGYTKLDPLFNNDVKFDFKNKDKIYVLYAPTHNMNLNKKAVTVSCYPRLDEYFTNIPNDIELLSSVHPANKGLCHATFDFYKYADVVISDCSSTLYEAMALDIPVVFPDWLVKEPILNAYRNAFEFQIYNEEIGYHAKNINNMWDLIRIAKDKKMDKKSKDFMEGIFPQRLRGNSGKVTAELFIKILNK